MKNKVVKILSFLLVISFAFLINNNVKAAECSAEKKAALLREAAEVKASYTPHVEICEVDDECYDRYKEGGEEEIHFDNPGEYYPIITDKYLTVELMNINENFKVNVRYDGSKANKVPSNIAYSDTENGKTSFKMSILNKSYKISFDILGSRESGCENEKLRVVELTLPQDNIYYNYVKCKEIEDFYLCQPFVNYLDEKMSLMSYTGKLNEEKIKRGIMEDPSKPINEKEKKNGFVVPMIIIVSGAAIVVASVIVMKGKKRD